MKKKNIIAAAGLHLLAPLALPALPPPAAADMAADDLITGFSAAMRFSELINPLPSSEKKEREKFFAARAKGDAYEPQFRYSPVKKKAAAMSRKLKALKPAGTAYGPFLSEAREQLLGKLGLLGARGSEDFHALSAALFPLPDQGEVAAALETLEKIGYVPPAQKAELSDVEMAAELEKALRAAGLKAWRVRVSARMSASASVSPGSRRVNIKKGRRFSRHDVDMLALHEIGVHAVRAENGHAMPLGIFRVGLEGYLETEEGMAAWREVEAGSRNGLRRFALRVLAVDWASRLPFSGVFSRLSERGVPDDLAWSLTQRVKRGLTDTGRPGCYGKDAAYFRGYLMVSSFLESGGSWDDLMRYGKVSVSHLPALKAMAAGR